MSLESTNNDTNARLPGTEGIGTKQRRPFSGRSVLCNTVSVRFERSFITELYDAGELYLAKGDALVVDTSKGPALAETASDIALRFPRYESLVNDAA